MSTSQDIRIRQAIWSEYRSGNNENRALDNIRKKFDTNFASRPTIRNWYQCFEANDEKITRVIRNLPGGKQKDSIESILFISDDIGLTSNMNTMNGRFVAVPSQKQYGKEFIFYDLFHNERKKIPVVNNLSFDYIFQIQFIGEEHLLVKVSFNLFLLKVDYKLWQISVVAKYDVSHGRIVLDELDNRKFIIKNEIFVMACNLTNDKITFGRSKQLLLDFCKLIGDQLFGFRKMYPEGNAQLPLWQYLEFDLVTLTEKTVDLSMILENKRINPSIGVYCWSGIRLYVTNEEFERDHIISFNPETLTWTDTGIEVYGRVVSMFIDKNDVLTLQVFKAHNAKESAFYRFPLKKPDSLKHLAWLTVVRNASLFKSSLFEKIRHRLPFGKGIRSLFDPDQ